MNLIFFKYKIHLNFFSQYFYIIAHSFFEAIVYLQHTRLAKIIFKWFIV